MSILCYAFGPFVLLEAGPVLLRSGDLVPATAKVLATLTVLVRSQGRTVSKAELLSEVWPDSFVEDGNLTQNIFILRKIMADDFPDRSPIETVPKVGYRFVEPVEVRQFSAREAPVDGPVSPALRASAEQPDAANPVTPAGQPAVFVERRKNPIILPAYFQAPPAEAKKQHRLYAWRWPALFGLLVIGLTMFVRAEFFQRPRADTDSISPIRFTSKASEDRLTGAAISPDGRLMAYADADGVVLQTVGDPAMRLLQTPPMQRVDHLAWFPDGLHLALSGTSKASSSPEVWTISTQEAPPVIIRDNARLGIPSPDGTQVAFLSGNSAEVWVAGPAGEGARRLTSVSAETTFTLMLWSGNGKTIMLERSTPVLRSAALAGSDEAMFGAHSAYSALDVVTGKITTSMEGMRFEAVCLLHDDQLLLARSERTEDYNGSTSLWKVQIDPATGAFTSTAQQVGYIPRVRLTALSVARSGEVAAILTQSYAEVYVGALHWPGPMLDAAKRLSLDASVAYPHAWMPDSASVLFESNRDGPYHIYRQGLDRHDPDPVVTMTGLQASPHVSPDHRWLLFVSRRTLDTPFELFRVPLQGGTPARIEISHSGTEVRCPSVGKTCILRTVGDRRQSTFSTFDPVTGHGADVLTLPVNSFNDWDISPDGAVMAFAPRSPQTPEIRTVLLQSGQTQVIPVDVDSGITAINWAVDQKGWFVATEQPNGNSLFYVDSRGKSTLLRRTTGSTWAIQSPDRQKLAWVEQNVDSNVWMLHMKTTDK